MTAINDSLIDDLTERKRLLFQIIDTLGIPAKIDNDDLPKFRSPAQPAQLTDFFKITGDLINETLLLEGRSKDNLIFRHKFPTSEDNPGSNEIITYQVISREPGTFGKGQPGDGPHARKPRLVDVQND